MRSVARCSIIPFTGSIELVENVDLAIVIMQLGDATRKGRTDPLDGLLASSSAAIPRAGHCHGRRPWTLGVFGSS